MATEFPTRGQRAPQFWDEQLQAYIDESTNQSEIEPGSPFEVSLTAKIVRVAAPPPTGDAVVDTAALLATADSVSSAVAAEIALCSGTYEINASLPLRTGLRWVGQGHSQTTLRLANGSNCDLFLSDDFASLTGGSVPNPAAAPHGWAVEEMTIAGRRAGQTGTSWGIRSYGHAWIARGVQIRDFRSGGLYSEFSRGFSLPENYRGLESLVEDCDIHHNGGWGYRHKGPSDCLLRGSFIWENGLDNTSGGLLVDSGSNGFNALQLHTYGNIGWAVVSDAQIFMSDCQIEGGRSGPLGVECGGVWLRFPDCTISGGAIYYTASAPSSGIGLRLGVAGETPVYATRAKIDTMILYCTGVTVNQSAIHYAADSHSDIRAQVYISGGGANAITGTADAGSVQQIKIVGSSAPSRFTIRGKVRANLPAADTDAFVLHDGTERRVLFDTASGQLRLGRAGLVVYADDMSTEKFAVTVAGRIIAASTTKPTVVAGSGAGTTPPAPVLDNDANLLRGSFTCGTGATPAVSQPLVAFTLGGYARKPTVIITPGNGAAAGLNALATTISATGFEVRPTVAPAASQADTAYRFNYLIIG